MKNIVGQKFGRLFVVEFAEIDKHQQAKWVCNCDCGNQTTVATTSLVCGKTKSCGCLQRELATTHGHCIMLTGKKFKASPEYGAYHNAKDRCENPKNRAYFGYGGRGIQFRFSNFEEFSTFVGPRPSSLHSLDRIDNDRHYEPGNVRWSTASEQQNNRRPSTKWTRRDCGTCNELRKRIARLENIFIQLDEASA